MYFAQADLLRGMSKDFIKRFMDNTVKETHRKGKLLFRAGNPANSFYVLLKGRIKLTVGETGQRVYTVDQPGEAFGWSSLLGRDAYSATAECREQTKILRIDVAALNQILEQTPADGLIFFKRLAATLGNRLLQTYRMVSTSSEPGISPSFGSSRVLESEANIT
ncbi:MAG: cyclic nucleotide-binding domain-containing protein [Deltaproteobacteria bacterium]|nr:cyclic nucleotide-binding domain-containing protein [Deltaproteobacteria bacterium]